MKNKSNKNRFVMEIDLDIKPLIKEKNKRTRFRKYAEAIGKAKLVPWLKEKIDNSFDKNIRILTKDIAKQMGEEFENKSNNAVYLAVKFILFHEGIIVDTGISKNDEHILVMRKRNEEDILPSSLKDIEKPILEKPEFRIYEIFK